MEKQAIYASTIAYPDFKRLRPYTNLFLSTIFYGLVTFLIKKGLVEYRVNQQRIIEDHYHERKGKEQLYVTILTVSHIERQR